MGLAETQSNHEPLKTEDEIQNLWQPHKMNSVMLDLETMSTSANAAIVAIGAVRFNSDNGVTSYFYEVVDLESAVAAGLEMSASTVLWWLAQSDSARKELCRKGDQLNHVLGQFKNWLGKDAEVWGNGSDFDNVILSNAYNKYSWRQPWPYANNRCYRTIKNLRPDIKIVRTGTHHNALDDAISQTDHLLRITQCDQLRSSK